VLQQISSVKDMKPKLYDQVLREFNEILENPIGFYLVNFIERMKIQDAYLCDFTQILDNLTQNLYKSPEQLVEDFSTVCIRNAQILGPSTDIGIGFLQIEQLAKEKILVLGKEKSKKDWKNHVSQIMKEIGSEIPSLPNNRKEFIESMNKIDQAPVSFADPGLPEPNLTHPYHLKRIHHLIHNIRDEKLRHELLDLVILNEGMDEPEEDVVTIDLSLCKPGTLYSLWNKILNYEIQRL
jgi:hypothetical protein